MNRIFKHTRTVHRQRPLHGLITRPLTQPRYITIVRSPSLMSEMTSRALKPSKGSPPTNPNTVRKADESLMRDIPRDQTEIGGNSMIRKIELGTTEKIPLVDVEKVIASLPIENSPSEILIPSSEFSANNGITLELPNFFTPGGPVHLYTLLPDIPGEGITREHLIRVISDIYVDEFAIANKFRHEDHDDILDEQELRKLRFAKAFEWRKDRNLLRVGIDLHVPETGGLIGF